MLNSLEITNDATQSAPPYRDPALHFHAPRLASRYAGETGTRKPPKQIIREVCLCAAPAHVHSAREAFAAGEQLAAHTQPALRAGLMAPAWRLLDVSQRAIPDLT